MRTKWEILQERAALQMQEAQKAYRYLEALRETTLGIECAGCGEMLETEADFAQHFLIPNEKWLNLGDCPKTD